MSTVASQKTRRYLLFLQYKFTFLDASLYHTSPLASIGPWVHRATFPSLLGPSKHLLQGPIKPWSTFRYLKLNHRLNHSTALGLYRLKGLFFWILTVNNNSKIGRACEVHHGRGPCGRCDGPQEVRTFLKGRKHKPWKEQENKVSTILVGRPFIRNGGKISPKKLPTCPPPSPPPAQNI